MVSKAVNLLVDNTTESFTELEARVKIGKTVRLLTDHNNLHKGMIGHVVDFHEIAKDDFEVVVRWGSLNGSDPVHDGFSKRNYDRLLSEE